MSDAVWIDATLQQPESRLKVLVHHIDFDTGKMRVMLGQCFYDPHGNRVWKDERNDYLDVTHWMTLPAPPTP